MTWKNSTFKCYKYSFLLKLHVFYFILNFVKKIKKKHGLKWYFSMFSLSNLSLWNSLLLPGDQYIATLKFLKCFCAGGALDRYAPIPEPVLGRMAVNIIQGLCYMWSLKILHRGEWQIKSYTGIWDWKKIVMRDGKWSPTCEWETNYRFVEFKA